MKGTGESRSRFSCDSSRDARGLTNKSDNKICILVALLSPLLDPGLQLCRPFHVAPYLRYSFAFPPPALSASPLFSLSPSLSSSLVRRSQPLILTTSFPTLSTENGGRLNRHEKSTESSRAVRLKSPESHRSADSAGKPIGRIRKRAPEI